MNKDNKDIFSTYADRTVSKRKISKDEPETYWSLIGIGGANSELVKVYKNYGNLDAKNDPSKSADSYAYTLAKELMDEYDPDKVMSFGRVHWEYNFPDLNDPKGEPIVGSYAVGEGYYLAKTLNPMRDNNDKWSTRPPQV
jgi:hypothetical protein